MIIYYNNESLAKMTCAKSPTNKHQLKDHYSGSLRMVEGDIADNVKYEGTFCRHCCNEFIQETAEKDVAMYADYSIGKDPLDPRD